MTSTAPGNETIIGGIRRGHAQGGGGNNNFQYWSVTDAGDIITDFNSATDSFQFRLPWTSGGFSGGFSLAN